MLSCQRATQLLSERLDRPLSLSERAALRIHLMMCRGCSNFGEQMGTIRQLTQQYREQQSQDD